MSVWAPLQIEYNLLRSYKNHLDVLDIHQTDQGSYPTCMIWYPPLTKELFLLISNSGYKVKLFNSTTKMCRYARGGVGVPTNMARNSVSQPLAYVKSQLKDL